MKNMNETERDNLSLSGSRMMKKKEEEEDKNRVQGCQSLNKRFESN